MRLRSAGKGRHGQCSRDPISARASFGRRIRCAQAARNGETWRLATAARGGEEVGESEAPPLLHREGGEKTQKSSRSAPEGGDDCQSPIGCAISINGHRRLLERCEKGSCGLPCANADPRSYKPVRDAACSNPSYERKTAPAAPTENRTSKKRAARLPPNCQRREKEHRARTAGTFLGRRRSETVYPTLSASTTHRRDDGAYRVARWWWWWW